MAFMEVGQMSTRSAAETLAGIFLAFLEQPTWTQAELARRVGVGPRALRQRLEELREAGQMPLSRDHEPPHVYWSVAKGWVPGGVSLSGKEALLVLGLLARLPRSTDRDRFVKRLTAHVGGEPSTNATPLRGDEQTLAKTIEAASLQVPLQLDYFSTHQGDRRLRIVSVHKVLGGDRWHFEAMCHDRKRLCWFRIDSVLSAALARDVRFLSSSPEELQDFLNGSLDGFSGSGEPTLRWFVVRYPEARWVRLNLPEQEAFDVVDVAEGLRFEAKTTAVDVVARFVVGLGRGVTSCEPGLAERVREIALGVLGGLERDGNTDSSR